MEGQGVLGGQGVKRIWGGRGLRGIRIEGW